MFAGINSSPLIMVAPNGARRNKGHHQNLPVSIEEIRDETVACARAGADALHLHVREPSGKHTLDAGIYKEAIGEIQKVLPGFPIQVTTESAGIFSVEEQLHCLNQLRPAAASISVREIARSPQLSTKLYGLCEDQGIAVQHILYDRSDWQKLETWRSSGVIHSGQDDVIFVLGAYAPPTTATVSDVQKLSRLFALSPGRVMVCAFGAKEHEVLCNAAMHGADLRIGFENNIQGPDGKPATSNAANVARLKAALDAASTGVTS